VPFPAGWRGYLALIQCRGDSSRGSAREFGEDRAQLLSAFLGVVAVLDALGVQSAQLDALGFPGRQRVLGTARNHGALFLSQRGVEMQHERVRISTQFRDDKRRLVRHQGESNKSDLRGVLQTNNIHIAIAAPGEVTKTLAALKASPATARAKAKFILATDGDTGGKAFASANWALVVFQMRAYYEGEQLSAIAPALKPRGQVVSQNQGDIGRGRKFLEWIFWIWGTGGFLICSFNYFSLSGTVGVGTSTYMALGFLYWLGGMLLFGTGALIAAVERPPVTNSNARPNTPEDRDNPYLPHTPEGKAWAKGLADRAARGDGNNEKTTEGRALAHDHAPASTSRWRWDRDV
jgi:hypothetical protein